MIIQAYIYDTVIHPPVAHTCVFFMATPVVMIPPPPFPSPATSFHIVQPSMITVIDRPSHCRGLFDGLPDAFEVARYHSLYGVQESFPEELRATAITADGVVRYVCSLFLGLFSSGVHLFIFTPHT